MDRDVERGREIAHRNRRRDLHAFGFARLHLFLALETRLLVLHFLLEVLALFHFLPRIHDAARVAIRNFDGLAANVKTKLGELAAEFFG
ncbi:hypothetical protein HYS28_00635 [Candidatus Uhrbacteria bacterium]|nr:hypothetical protein [Candidatus Uhrbacteria bacterium]